MFFAKECFLTVLNRKFFIYAECDDIRRGLEFPVSLWVESKNKKNIIHLGNYRLGMWQCGIYEWLRYHDKNDHFVVKEAIKEAGIEEYKSDKFIESLPSTWTDGYTLDKLY